MCKEHKTPLSYYCNTCKKPICSDCAMFGDTHKSHQFERLKDVGDVVEPPDPGLHDCIGEVGAMDHAGGEFETQGVQLEGRGWRDECDECDAHVSICLKSWRNPCSYHNFLVI